MYTVSPMLWLSTCRTT